MAEPWGRQNDMSERELGLIDAADRRVRNGPKPGPLSGRQAQVLHCRCELGLTLRETATRLGITPKTVANHEHRLLIHLAARSIEQACCRYGRRTK